MRVVFGWGKKKAQDNLSPEVKKIFEKIGRLFESEAFQNSLLPEPLKAVVLNGQNCDKIPGASGEFGRDPTNPIPVNGPIGEILYLSQLRTEAQALRSCFTGLALPASAMQMSTCTKCSQSTRACESTST